MPSRSEAVDGERNMRWKTRLWSFSGMPMPSSDTTILTLPSAVARPMEIVAPLSEYLQALESRFVTTDSIFTASASIIICPASVWNTNFLELLFSLKASKIVRQKSTRSNVDIISRFSPFSSISLSSRVR